MLESAQILNELQDNSEEWQIIAKDEKCCLVILMSFRRLVSAFFCKYTTIRDANRT